MIKVGYLKDFSAHYSNPDTRAAMMGHAALDYYRACALTNEYERDEKGWPLFNFLLPTMHQTLELLTKAIALKSDNHFDPKKYSHRTLSVLKDYSKNIPVFASVVSNSIDIDLITALEVAYLGVRYGECCISYDGDMWCRFVTISEIFFADLSVRTGLRFPMAHWLP